MGEELSAVCVSTAATVLHQADLVVPRLVRHGSDEQRGRFLPRPLRRLADRLPGDDRAGGGLRRDEHAHASDVRGRRLPAERRKTFITSAPVADLALVYAVTGEPGSRSLGLFIVATTRHGITRGKKFSKMGWRGSPTGELVLDDCVVPAETLIGAEGDGRAIMFAGLNTERVVMAAESVGLSQGALDVAVAYARERRQFGRPIGDFQLIQGKLADDVRGDRGDPRDG